MWSSRLGAATRSIRSTKGLSASDAEAEAIALLESAGIDEARARLRAYPHQFSGGMRQRVVIALALCGDPDLIIADEPTTALDVSIQAQILDLIKSLCASRQLGVVLVTHDIGVQPKANRSTSTTTGWAPTAHPFSPQPTTHCKSTRSTNASCSSARCSRPTSATSKRSTTSPSV